MTYGIGPWLVCLWQLLVLLALSCASRPGRRARRTGPNSYEIPLRSSIFIAEFPGARRTAAQRGVSTALTVRSTTGPGRSTPGIPQTGTPHFLYGSGVQVGIAVHQRADAVIARPAASCRPTRRSSRPTRRTCGSTRPAGMGKRAVHFQQLSRLSMSSAARCPDLHGRGPALRRRLRLLPDIQVDPNPSIPASVAKEIAPARAALRPSDRLGRGRARQLLVLPVPLSETEVDLPSGLAGPGSHRGAGRHLGHLTSTPTAARSSGATTTSASSTTPARPPG